jgi:hypothetical protein
MAPWGKGPEVCSMLRCDEWKATPPHPGFIFFISLIMDISFLCKGGNGHMAPIDFGCGYNADESIIRYLRGIGTDESNMAADRILLDLMV